MQKTTIRLLFWFISLSATTKCRIFLYSCQIRPPTMKLCTFMKNYLCQISSNLHLHHFPLNIIKLLIINNLIKILCLNLCLIFRPFYQAEMEENSVESFLVLCYDVFLEYWGNRRQLIKLERVGQRFHWNIERFFSKTPILRLDLLLAPRFFDFIVTEYWGNRRAAEWKQERKQDRKQTSSRMETGQETDETEYWGNRRQLIKLERVGQRFHWNIERIFSKTSILRLDLLLAPRFFDFIVT